MLGVDGCRHGQAVWSKEHILVECALDELEDDLVGVVEELRLGVSRLKNFSRFSMVKTCPMVVSQESTRTLGQRSKMIKAASGSA